MSFSAQLKQVMDLAKMQEQEARTNAAICEAAKTDTLNAYWQGVAEALKEMRRALLQLEKPTRGDVLAAMEQFMPTPNDAKIDSMMKISRVGRVVAIGTIRALVQTM